LKDHMRKAGDVIFADVMKDHNGRSKGYGVVEYKSYDDMRYAIRKLDDTELEGSYIRVREVCIIRNIFFLCVLLFLCMGCVCARVRTGTEQGIYLQ